MGPYEDEDIMGGGRLWCEENEIMIGGGFSKGVQEEILSSWIWGWVILEVDSYQARIGEESWRLLWVVLRYKNSFQH